MTKTRKYRDSKNLPDLGSVFSNKEDLMNSLHNPTQSIHNPQFLQVFLNSIAYMLLTNLAPAPYLITLHIHF